MTNNMDAARMKKAFEVAIMRWKYKKYSYIVQTAVYSIVL